MEQIAKETARRLLEIQAVRLSPAHPFTWASGWKSPIYCDNRKTLSFPEVRAFIRDSFCALIRRHYPEAGQIAGVATGAIAHGVLVAEALGLPFCYVRPAPKDHGLANQIEGSLAEGKKVLILEDLVSTGGSSLNAFRALRTAGADVVGMVAIFTYRFPEAERKFREAGCALMTLSDYPSLLEIATETGYVSPEQMETLREWSADPGAWNPAP